MAKRIDAAQATTGKKKMSKKRKFLIALGVIAAVLVGAWVAVINPAINNLVTEQVQAAGLEGAIVEVHADGAKITLPTLPASMAGSGLDATNLVVEFGGIGVSLQVSHHLGLLLPTAASQLLSLPQLYSPLGYSHYRILYL